jgi:hypothetical protein
MTQKCTYENCKRYATYNYADQKKRIYCGEHKKENMVDVAHKKCIEPGCTAQPTYNFPGEKKRLFCVEHKKNGMIDTAHKKCIEPECNKRPIFNLENEKLPLYCKKHKSENMIDITNKKCAHDGCNKQPNFNKKGNTKRLFCLEHKSEDMVDVINKRCIYEECLSQASYNIKGINKGLYCAKHKSENMVRIECKRCIHEYCDKQPSYNYEGLKKRLYCTRHKKEDMINISQKMCKNNCTVSASEKYKGYCLFCFIHLFPDEPVTRNYKTKEKHITDNVKENYKGYNWVCDKLISGGCSRRRPDMFLELDNQCIIIEIDENQHTDYDCTCENKRIMELSKDVGHKPIVFIRFNPDDYLDGENNITSCWGNGKDGICRIKKNKVKEWNNRMNTLKEQINYWIKPENTTNKTIEIIQLFYDK